MKPSCSDVENKGVQGVSGESVVRHTQACNYYWLVHVLDA